MVKSGAERAEKVKQKYDVDIIMLRIKALQNFSIDKFALPAQQQAVLDENLQQWINEEKLGFGARGRLYDFVRKIVWKWENLTAEAKNLLHEQWLEQGLPESIWQKLEAKHNEITTLSKTYQTQNITVLYETDVFPYPEQNINPTENDFIIDYEQLKEETEVYTQNFWRQQRLSYGNCDYMMSWAASMTDQTANLNVNYETIPSMLADKTANINVSITEPFQNNLEYAENIILTKDFSTGERKNTIKTNSFQTSYSTTAINGYTQTLSINITYATQLT